MFNRQRQHSSRYEYEAGVERKKKEIETRNTNPRKFDDEYSTDRARNPRNIECNNKQSRETISRSGESFDAFIKKKKKIVRICVLIALT